MSKIKLNFIYLRKLATKYAVKQLICKYKPIPEKCLRQFEIIYNNGEHPLEVWKAINMCYTHDFSYPKWVTDALFLISVQLYQIDTQVKKKLPQLVFEAMGIEGREFGDWRRRGEDINFCLDIERRCRETWAGKPKTLTRAREEHAKENGLSFVTVKDKHKKLKSNPNYKDMISNYLDEGGVSNCGSSAHP